MAMEIKKYIQETRVKKSELAKHIGVSAALLYQWIEGIRPVAINHCLAIEQATNGAVTRKDLRPNDWQKIWPDYEPA